MADEHDVEGAAGENAWRDDDRGLLEVIRVNGGEEIACALTEKAHSLIHTTLSGREG